MVFVIKNNVYMNMYANIFMGKSIVLEAHVLMIVKTTPCVFIINMEQPVLTKYVSKILFKIVLITKIVLSLISINMFVIKDNVNHVFIKIVNLAVIIIATVILLIHFVIKADVKNINVLMMTIVLQMNFVSDHLKNVFPKKILVQVIVIVKQPLIFIV